MTPPPRVLSPDRKPAGSVAASLACREQGWQEHLWTYVARTQVFRSLGRASPSGVASHMVMPPFTVHRASRVCAAVPVPSTHRQWRVGVPMPPPSPAPLLSLFCGCSRLTGEVAAWWRESRPPGPFHAKDAPRFWRREAAEG